MYIHTHMYRVQHTRLYRKKGKPEHTPTTVVAMDTPLTHRYERTLTRGKW